MAIRLGDEAPDFTAQSTDGEINFHDWIGDDWAVLFSHPKDFTPVCTTELGQVAKLKPEFAKRGVKVVGLSVDGVENHAGWSKDIEETQGVKLNFPLVADPDRVADVLATGAARARVEATAVLAAAREAVGMAGHPVGPS